MKLIYKEANGKKKQGDLVQVGDRVLTFRGEVVEVMGFREPHKPSSCGHVSLKEAGSDFEHEYYVSVIDAEWIEREDREDFIVPQFVYRTENEPHVEG